ncbi:MAG: hypothetical protein JW902_04645 [Syntrophaceae bacterium]|nr:hypothetical protein [Syntrophaceae bacterium]
MSDEGRPALKIGTYYVKKNNIVEKRPVDTLLNRGIGSIIGQSIWQINFSMGSYGMGGPGFVGLLLGSQQGSEEWMVFTIWGADWSMLFDDHWVGAHPMFYQQQKPLRSDVLSGGKLLEWDNFSGQIINGKIVDAKLTDKTFVMSIEQNGIRHKFEVLDEDPRLPPMPKGGPRRTLSAADKLGDYIIFHEVGGKIDTVENKATES